uniref:ORFan n=1 Tax=Rhabditophanes sp. KR3021 TaxID=114890 RepID=A0AC35TGV7_9BILA
MATPTHYCFLEEEIEETLAYDNDGMIDNKDVDQELEKYANKLASFDKNLPCIDCFEHTIDLLTECEGKKEYECPEGHTWGKVLKIVVERILRYRHIDVGYKERCFAMISELIRIEKLKWLDGDFFLGSLIVSLCQVELNILLIDCDDSKIREIEAICYIYGDMIGCLAEDCMDEEGSLKIFGCLLNAIKECCFVLEKISEETDSFDCIKECLYYSIVSFVMIEGEESLNVKKLSDLIIPIGQKMLRSNFERGSMLIKCLQNFSSLPVCTINYIMSYYSICEEIKYSEGVENISKLLELLKDNTDFYSQESLTKFRNVCGKSSGIRRILDLYYL